MTNQRSSEHERLVKAIHRLVGPPPKTKAEIIARAVERVRALNEPNKDLAKVRSWQERVRSAD